MRILFLNQFFPPDPAPTGVLFRELADVLAADGHAVNFVAARREYRGGQGTRGRMGRELKALGVMLLDGLRAPRADVVISGTSPPCLLVVATLVALRHRARSIHWIMDLYPEIAVALGELRDGFLARVISKMMGWAYRRCARVVALDSDMAERLRRHGIEAEIVRPWVFRSVLGQRESAAPVEPWAWVYSGNLGRAHEWATLLEAQAILERRACGIRLLFQGGGPSWPAAQARAKALGLEDCEWRPYVAEEELRASLLRAECCVVTQLPVAQGLLWPSKLGLLLTLPRPILWVGPVDGAIARELRALPHTGVFAPGQAGEIADWLEALRASERTFAAIPAFDAEAHRARSLETLRVLVGGRESS